MSTRSISRPRPSNWLGSNSRRATDQVRVALVAGRKLALSVATSGHAMLQGKVRNQREAQG